MSTTNMPQAPDSGKLAVLGGQANAHHFAAERSINDALGHARAAGEPLNEVKALLPHGEFAEWLRENFAASDRTARAYMRIAREWDAIAAKSANSATLSIDGALRLLAEPRDPQG